MEKFGWPMGPAYLLDVVGVDTAEHCTEVMSTGFPSRMKKIVNDPVSLLYKNNRLGQKNGLGFFLTDLAVMPCFRSCAFARA